MIRPGRFGDELRIQFAEMLLKGRSNFNPLGGSCCCLSVEFVNEAPQLASFCHQRPPPGYLHGDGLIGPRRTAALPSRSESGRFTGPQPCSARDSESVCQQLPDGTANRIRLLIASVYFRCRGCLCYCPAQLNLDRGTASGLQET
jgi:hypothetical protein